MYPASIQYRIDRRAWWRLCGVFGSHGAACSDLRMYLKSFSGWRGISVIRRSSGLRASSTALMMAAGAPTVPPSPHPLIPSSFSGDGNCWWCTSMGGTSLARGRR